MHRLLTSALLFTVVVTITACSFNRVRTEINNQSAQTANQQSPAKVETAPSPAQPGEVQPGQASGTYTARGEVVELKYAYAGRGVRFGTESLVILPTDHASACR